MPDPGRRPPVSLRVALTQWRPVSELAANLAVAEELVARAGAGGAELVLLPENGLLLDTNERMRAAALALDSAPVDRLRRAAARAGCAVVLGGFKRRDPDGEVYNTALAITAQGRIAGGYDKIHLFDARVAGVRFRASTVERPGNRPVLLQLGPARLGLTICYDVRFPELYRRLALAGAAVFLVPSAFTVPTGAAHWEVLLRARAIENGAFVVASATVGSDGDPVPTYGHAMAVDPWGTVLADLGARRRAVEVVDLPLAEVDRVRADLPVLRGVRPEAYGCDPEVIDVSASARGAGLPAGRT